MANDISGGSVVGKLRFNIDKKSWDNLALFQKKLTSVKRQMSGLKGTIKVNAVVKEIEKVNRAVRNGIGMEFGRAKGSDRTYASWWEDALKAKEKAIKDHDKNMKNRSVKQGKLGHSTGDVSHLFGRGEVGMKASSTLFAKMLRDEEKAATKQMNEAEKRRFDIQKRWDKRRFTRLKRDEHIEYRMQGMKNTFANRLGEGSLGANMSTGRSMLATTIAQYRAGKIDAKTFNQQVSATTQSLVKQGIVARNNAISLRSLRSDLVQATAAYTAFSTGANIFNTGRQLQGLEAGMRVFSDSDAGVRENMKWVEETSERIGINFMAMAQNFTKFSIVAKNKMSQTEIKSLFTAVSEYATVMQADQHQFDRGMKAINQMVSKGQIMKEELTGQLSEAFYGSTSVFAEAAGFGTGADAEGKLFKAMEAGLIKPTKKFMTEVGRIYAERARQGGALTKAQKSVNAEFERFQKSVKLASKEFFDGGFADGLVHLFKRISELLNTTDVKTFGAVFGGVIKSVADSLWLITLPIKNLINLAGMLFGEDGGKWLGYGLGVAFLASKLYLVANVMKSIVQLSKLFAKTPIGFAITAASVLGGSYLLDKALTEQMNTQSMAKPAASIAQQYSQPSRSSSTVNVIVQPDGSEFGRAVRATYADERYNERTNTVSELVG